MSEIKNENSYDYNLGYYDGVKDMIKAIECINRYNEAVEKEIELLESLKCGNLFIDFELEQIKKEFKRGLGKVDDKKIEFHFNMINFELEKEKI